MKIRKNANGLCQHKDIQLFGDLYEEDILITFEQLSAKFLYKGFTGAALLLHNKVVMCCIFLSFPTDNIIKRDERE